MKALILAAGLGTRLAPHSLTRPKALFPVAGRPVLDRAIMRMIAAGCDRIGVNTHHLADQIQAFLAARDYPIPVEVRHEPVLLGTGGAIRNFADFWHEGPGWVINADVVTDIALDRIWADHRRHGAAVTLAMHDRPEFNTVCMADDGRILSFETARNRNAGCRRRAFTGIQIVTAPVVDYLPAQGPATSITAYARMIADGMAVHGCDVSGHYWEDIGTPDRYRRCVLAQLLARHFGQPASALDASVIVLTPLSGDGSDRRWFRAACNGRTVVVADHGFGAEASPAEADAFVAIGRHLHQQQVAVPAIEDAEPTAGLVCVSDWGDTHFQSAVLAEPDPATQIQLYRPVLTALADLAIDGIVGFRSEWTWQTRAMDRTVFVDQECGYFMRSFVSAVLPGMTASAELAREFDRLADRIALTAIAGLVHRDCQSRNIMWHRGRIAFIDFQGARPGPIQYDVASLIIDPYVALTESQQHALVDMAATIYRRRTPLDADRFHAGVALCALSRNLQILGAFAHLSRIKQKPGFARYIPTALETLDRRLAVLKADFPELASVVERLPRDGVWWRLPQTDPNDKELP